MGRAALSSPAVHNRDRISASISINGVSLTISKVAKGFFEINIIPHTLKLTNLKNLKNKDIVNVELDIFGKYIMKASS